MTKRNARQHYHVVSGLSGGYIPNTVETYTSRRDAEQGAIWHANNCREQELKVRGSASAGFYTVGDYEYIEINDCSDAACYCEHCAELLETDDDTIHRCEGN